MTRVLSGRMRSAVVLLLAAGGVALAACFSERSGITDPSGECELRIDVSQFPDVAAVVGIRDFAFVAPIIRVPRGSKVLWVNCEPQGTEAHTTTADGGEWDSPLLARSDVFIHEFSIEEFPEPGEFPYHCRPHPFMLGTVIVE